MGTRQVFKAATVGTPWAAAIVSASQQSSAPWSLAPFAGGNQPHLALSQSWSAPPPRPTVDWDLICSSRKFC